MDPIYHRENTTPAYQLNWGLTLFWRASRIPDTLWLAELQKAAEPDGVRVIKHRVLAGRESQFVLSTKPHVAPSEILRSVKGRLQHAIRDRDPRAFQRNYCLRSIGAATRSVVEAYVAEQLAHHRMADPRVEEQLEPLQKTYAEADLSKPSFTSHGMYWYNLHVAILNEQRWMDVRPSVLSTLCGMIERAAARHGDRLSRLAILPDHIHMTMGCEIRRSPEAVAFSYLVRRTWRGPGRGSCQTCSHRLGAGGVRRKRHGIGHSKAGSEEQMTDTMTDHGKVIAEVTLRALDRIPILPRRILLETPGVAATVPLLRGVWGAALHDLDRGVYHRVFEGKSAPVAKGRPSDTPGYILRPAPADPEFAPAVEWILIGDAIGDDEVLTRAWYIASGMGLGPSRRRFHLRQWVGLDAANRPTQASSPWRLGQCVWPCENPETSPCLLRCDAPLRLRRQGRLIERPSLVDLAVAATRRIAAFLPERDRGDWQTLSRRLHEIARRTPQQPWQGERLDLTRYSVRQQQDLDLHGVCGCLPLPAGPGPLWPLLAAASWLHLGKGTVMGLGQLRVERIHSL